MNLFKTSGLSINGIHYQNLAFEEGQITFIAGPSGAGKTTLLKLFNGTVSPTSGEVYYNGANIEKLDTISLRREVSLVGQELYLFDETIRENFNRFYSYRELPPPSDETLEKFLKICGLNCSSSSTCSTMSGGEKQRVYLAIFLSFMPKVLLLDEPTSALDNQNSNLIFENIFRFCKENEITVIVVSHDLFLATKFAESIINLDMSTQKEATINDQHYSAEHPSV